MGKGYTGKILKIDLGRANVKTEILSESFFRLWLGGYGLGARIVYSETHAGCDPLGSENILGFTTGLLTGTGSPCSSSFTVVGKSPLTGTWGDSRCGGLWGPELKFAGFDAVFIYGSADKPVYLLIEDGNVEVREASGLWGKDTAETEEILKDEYGDKKLQVACIGPAGEKLSKISCIIHDKGRAAGRSGLGALMGSKKLKAVAVRGTGPIAVGDKTLVSRLAREWFLNSKKDEGFARLIKYGTCGAVEDLAYVGDTPCKNWKGYGGKDFPACANISDDNVLKYKIRPYACWGCSIGCGSILEVRSGPFAARGHKPEYETLTALGTLCLNENVESIIYANDICNRSGIDTISAGGVIAFAMECYENGIITKNQTDGIDLTWGNPEGLIAILKAIAERKGIGDILADGVKIAAAKIGKGSENFAMHVGGQEVPMHDPKYAPALATTFTCDATPGRHTQGWEWTEGNQYRVPGVNTPRIEQYSPPGDSIDRAVAHAIAQKHAHIVNALGVCQDPTWYPAATPRYELFVSAVTGWDITIQDLLECGERIACIRQAFNVREGFKPSDFRLPGRVVGNPPLSYGPLKGVMIDAEAQSRQYFKVMKWDYHSGKPDKQRLIELGLEDVAKELYLRRPT